MSVQNKTLRMAMDKFEEVDYHSVRLRRRGMPSANEVAAMIVYDETENRKGQDIIVQYKDMRPRRISENLGMQYSLLFPYEEDGYRGNTHYISKEGAKCKRKHVECWNTMRMTYNNVLTN